MKDSSSFLVFTYFIVIKCWFFIIKFKNKRAVDLLTAYTTGGITNFTASLPNKRELQYFSFSLDGKQYAYHLC